MNRSDPNWDEYTVRESFRQLHYWLDRFDVSRDVEHLDNAERHAETARLYLPKCFQELTVRGLYNLYISSPSLSKTEIS